MSKFANLKENQHKEKQTINKISSKILVDADACPNLVKKILFRASIRTKIKLILIANQPIQYPNVDSIKNLVVEKVFDAADNKILELLDKDDLVITSDIPLAADVIENGASALNFRGEILTADNIKSRLNMRDFMETMRSSGMQIKSNNPSISQSELMTFANKLDTFLTKLGY